MEISPCYRRRAHLGLLLLLLIQFANNVLGQVLDCGSLITYRQHAVLLSQAPQCFRRGCNNATSISSSCPPSAPCAKLWDIIRAQFQRDSCADCGDDIACRIGGWPILNMTAACNIAPDQWLFYTNGGCCVVNDEPFQIADWVASLCNGSNWRTPFEYYGGMAKEDWEEWIEAWNWTLRVQNTSTQSFEQPECSSSNILWTLGIENFTRIGSFLFHTVVALGPLGLGFRVGPANRRIYWWASLLGGLSDGTLAVIGNLWSAFVIQNNPGYQDTPVGELFLLLCTRPSVVGFLCSLGFVAYAFEAERIRYGERPRPEGARQYIADTVASLAFAEIFMQIVGAAYLGRATNVGRQKDFYHVGHLTPYWRGSDAQTMYAGALIWTILSPFTMVGLMYLAYLQVEKVHHEGRIRQQPRQVARPLVWVVRKYLKRMNRFFDAKWQHHDATNQQPGGNRLLLAPENRAGNDRPDDTIAPANNDTPPGSETEEKVEVPRLKRRVRALTSRPLRWLTTLPYIYLYSDSLREQFALEEANQPLTEGILRKRRGLEAITRSVRGRYPAAQNRSPEDTLKEIRKFVTIFIVTLWVIVYIAQWLFWSGFVKSSGTRWCPPTGNAVMSRVRAILAVFSFLGITLNFIFNYRNFAGQTQTVLA